MAKYTKEVLISMLKKLGDEINRTPTQLDLKKYGLPSPNTFKRYFGSWNNALIESGYKPNHRLENYTKSELISLLNIYYKKFDKIPTVEGLYEAIKNGFNFPAPYQYIKHFGKFENAINQCDFFKEAKGKEEEQRKQYYLSELNRYFSIYKKVPTTRDLDKADGFPNSATIRRYFGNYQKALEESGLVKYKVHRKTVSKKPIYDKDSVKKIFSDFIHKNNRIPSYDDLIKYNLPSSNTVNKLFGNLNNLILELGFDVKHKSPKNKTDNELINDLKRLYKKLGRTPTKIDIDNDPICCNYRTYSKRFGGYYKMMERAEIPYEKKGKMFSDTEIIEIWKNIVKENGYYPTRKELIENKIFSPLITRWGNYFSFLKDLGVPINKDTYGFRIYKTKKGTVCYSKYELIITQWFEENNIIYDKEVCYSDIIKNYNYPNRFRFDWVVKSFGKLYCIEMFGIQNNKYYNEKVKLKKEICKKNNINLISLYPNDLKERKLDEIFSFLIKKVSQC
jgi:hypothetical protein